MLAQADASPLQKQAYASSSLRPQAPSRLQWLLTGQRPQLEAALNSTRDRSPGRWGLNCCHPRPPPSDSAFSGARRGHFDPLSLLWFLQKPVQRAQAASHSRVTSVVLTLGGKLPVSSVLSTLNSFRNSRRSRTHENRDWNTPKERGRGVKKSIRSLPRSAGTKPLQRPCEKSLIGVSENKGSERLLDQLKHLLSLRP